MPAPILHVPGTSLPAPTSRPEQNPQPSILIVGAGPTGLVLALGLAKAGVRARIVDRAPTPGTTSRAMAVQARTLELYRQLGIADAAVAAGLRMDHVVVRRRGTAVARGRLGEFGAGLSPYPFVLSLPQDVHERLLVERLAREGITVERGTELMALAQTGDRTRVTLRDATGEQTAAYDWVCGCDGARSAVRQALGIGFPGGTYDRVFYVADVRASGASATGGVNACMSPDGFALVFAVREPGTFRVVGIVPAEKQHQDTIRFEDVAPEIAATTKLAVAAVHWFSTYRVHHRVADRFRDGRVFLLGDAAHIHSPVGGQGMNTGIGDAVNLAWKLAACAQGRAAESLLDTYEPERRAFARTLVATTDRAFQLIASRSPLGWLARGWLLPGLTSLGLALARTQRLLFRTVSQVRIAYRKSALSSGRAGKVHGGDRLPWLPFPDGTDNHAPLASCDWQVHVYGSAGAALRVLAARRGVALHELPFTALAQRAGLARDAAYLVRPDGYVAMASRAQDAEALERHLRSFTSVAQAAQPAV